MTTPRSPKFAGWICPDHGQQPWDHRCDRWLQPLADAARETFDPGRERNYRLSPSTILGCLREHHIKVGLVGGSSFISPLAYMPMWDGTRKHQWLEEHPEPGWNHEVEVEGKLFPGEFDGFEEGVNFIAYIDRVNLATKEVEDFKGSEPFGEVNDSEGAAQLDLERRLIELNPKHQGMRMFLSYIRKEPYRYEIKPKSTDELLSFTPGNGLITLRQHIQAHLNFVASEGRRWETLPLSGLTMYVSTRKKTSSCSRCTVKKICDDLAKEDYI
jgi:hypothetical protein